MTAAKNCHVSVIDGASKRPGTEYTRAVTLVGGENYRSVPLVIDPSEQYIIVFGRPATTGVTVVRIFRVGGAEASVTIAAAAQTYLNTANADQLRFAPITKDLSLVFSTQLVAATSAAATYTISATWTDYGQMIANTPVDGTYHRATGADTDEAKPAGFYQYNVGGVTFAKAQFSTVSGREAATVVGAYDNSADNPQGFKVRCRKYALAVSGMTWNLAGKTLTKAAAYASYFASFQAGDQFHVATGSGPLVPGYYTVVNATTNVLTLDSDIGATDGATDIAGTNGISVEFDVQRAYDTVAQVDMYAVAQSFQTAFRASGAVDGLISWTAVGGSAGYFTLTSPFRGSGASIISTSAPSAGTDLSTVGKGFYFAGATLTAGTGSGSLTFPIASRWTQVSPSGSADGSINNTTFPLSMLRTAANAFAIGLTTPTPRISGDGTTNPTPSLFQKSGAITAVSASNPASITSLAHSRRTGDVLVLAGLGAGNGTYTITVVDADTFMIPSAASGTGTWTIGGAAITEAIVHRGRLGLFGSNYAVFSQARDYFNFYLNDYQNIVDSDPIDAPIGGREPANIDFVVDFNGRLVAFSKAPRQYEFGTPDTLTPSSASWTGKTRYSTYSIRPVLMDSFLYFLGPRTNKSVAWELRYDGIQLQYDAGEISAHVRDLLPMSLRSMVAGVNETVVLVLPTGNGSTSKLMVYRAFWDQGKKEQSEWVTYEFDPGVRLADLCVIDGDVYMLTETTGLILSITAAAAALVTTQVPHGHISGDTVYFSETQSTPSIDGARVITVVNATSFTVPVTTTVAAASSAGIGRWSNTDYMIEKLSLSREDPKAGYLYTIHLDRRLERIDATAGVNAAGLTTWTLPFPAQGSTLNRAVVKSSGAVVDISGATYAGNTIVLADPTNLYGGVGVYLGRYFDYQLQLTPPYFHDSSGIPDQMVGILLSDIVIAYQNSGDFSVRCDYDDARGDVTFTFTPTATLETGRFRAWTRGDGEHMTVFIESSGPKQLTIAAYQQQGDYAFGIR